MSVGDGGAARAHMGCSSDGRASVLQAEGHRALCVPLASIPITSTSFLIRLMQGAVRAFGINSCRAGQFGCVFQYGAGADCKSVAFNTAQLGAVRAFGIDSNSTHHLSRNHGRRRVWTQPALKAVATGNGEGSIPSSSASKEVPCSIWK